MGTSLCDPSVEELRADLREIQRGSPDWDLSTPGMRDAWDRGEKAAFLPYGKSMKDIYGQ